MECSHTHTCTHTHMWKNDLRVYSHTIGTTRGGLTLTKKSYEIISFNVVESTDADWCMQWFFVLQIMGTIIIDSTVMPAQNYYTNCHDSACDYYILFV